MAEKFRFMDPVQLEDGTYDREYNAQEFTDYFKALVTTGVMKSVGAQLKVSANGSNMVSTISNGIAFILGRYYENDDVVNLTHDTESLGNSRIDRLVIRMDLSPDKRHVLAFVKKGTPSANPVPPSLTQTQTVYEISLAQVRIVGGQTFIAANAVTDERGTSVICPWAGSNILPSFDDNALAQHIANTNVHLQSDEREIWNNKGETIAKGGLDYEDIDTIQVQFFLSNHTKLGGGLWYVENRWFSNKGQGANQMQVAYKFNGNGADFKVRYKYGGTWSSWSPSLQELFQSVSSGKAKIASATSDMGVYTSPDASFDQMAANIRKIYTGLKTATGFTYASNKSLVVSGLPFTPSIVLIKSVDNQVNIGVRFSVMAKATWFANASGGIASYVGFVLAGDRATYWINDGSMYAGGFTSKVNDEQYPNGNVNWLAIGQ